MWPSALSSRVPFRTDGYSPQNFSWARGCRFIFDHSWQQSLPNEINREISTHTYPFWCPNTCRSGFVQWCHRDDRIQLIKWCFSRKLLMGLICPCFCKKGAVVDPAVKEPGIQLTRWYSSTPIPWLSSGCVVIVLLLSCYLVVIVVLPGCYRVVIGLIWS